MVTRVICAISSVRVPARPGEYDIHGMIAAALEGEGLAFAHEYRLGPRKRVDFMCGSVAVEVKKGRPQRTQLVSQLARYMESPEVSALVVVMQRRVALPEMIHGKKVHVVSLNMLWGVALP